jgi:amino acid permease
MSWQKTAVLLFGDQVCLAIMAQAWSFKVLGWIPGLITTFLSGAIFWLTSYTLWQFMMRNPKVRDICDIGRLLFGGSRLAYEFTGIMLLANNSMLAGFHVLTGAKILNTLSNHAMCTVYFSVIVTIASIVLR